MTPQDGAHSEPNPGLPAPPHVANPFGDRGGATSFPALAGALAVLLGLVVLLGWWLGVPLLTSLRADWVSMKPNTALGFVLTGAGLWLLAPGSVPGWRRNAACAAALGAMCLGLLTLVEYGSGADLHIDQALFNDLPGAVGTPFPGRMSPATAIGFVLLGAALLLITVRSRRAARLAEALAVATGVLSLISVIGYLYGVDSAIGAARYTSIAFHTAAGLLLLSVGELVCLPDGWIMGRLSSRGLEGAVVRRLLPAVLPALLALGWLRLYGERAGYLDSGLGVVLMVAAAAILISAVILWGGATLAGVVNAHRESEAHLRRAILAAPIPILIHDEEGANLHLSRGWTRYSGYTLADIPTIADWTRLAYGEKQAWASDYIDKLFEIGETVQNGEWSVQAKDGSTRVWEFQTTPLGRSVTGRRLLLSLAADVTDRKMTETALRLSEERLRLAVSAGRLGVWHWDIMANRIEWSAETKAMFGIAPDAQVDYGVFLAALHPEDREPTDRLVARSLEDRTEFTAEYRVIWPDGSLHWISAAGRALYDGAGRPEWMMGVTVDVTERKRVEEDLRASHNLFRTLAQISPVGIFRTDAQGKSLFVNETWCHMAGMSAEEAMGDGWSRSIHPEDRESVYREWMACAAARTPFRHEYRFQRPDGTVTWIIGQAVAEESPAGEVVGYVGTVTDITERKNAEEASARLAAIVRSSASAIIGKRLDGTVTSWNASAERIFGYSAAEMIGQPINRLIPPELQPEAKEFLQRVGRGEQVGPVETTRRTRDGRLIPIEFSESPLYDRAGEVIGAASVKQDITQRKAVEAALRESEERFRTLAESLPQLVWTSLPDGRCDYLSRQWVAYTGRPESEQLEHGWAGQVHPEDRAAAEAAWTSAVQAEAELDVEFRLRRHDGEYRWFKARATPMRDAEGAVVKWFGTNTDIEDLKLAEAAVRELNRGLEERVRERTAALEASNKELEAFSYSVSHDLRAPLRGVDSFSLVLLEDYGPKLDAEGRRLLSVVRGEAQRMGRLIDDLLEFSRMGRKELQATPLDMTAMVRSAFEALTPDVRGRARLDLAPLPPAYGDPVMLLQVWKNLVANAVKFSSKAAEPEVVVGAVDGGDEITYFIRDNGVGFDPRFAPKLFGVFQRLHSESEFEGTGVGLALVQRIIHRHGGRVWAEGQVNGGATFSFSLPHNRRGTDGPD